MSIEDLQADLSTNMEACKALISPLTTASDLAAHLHNNLYPFLGNVVREVEEVDDAVSTLFNEAEDILQPETAKLFATMIAGSQVLVAELKKRLTPTDVKFKTAIDEWEKLASAALSTLAEVTLDGEGEEDDEEDEDEDGDEADDEEED